MKPKKQKKYSGISSRVNQNETGKRESGTAQFQDKRHETTLQRKLRAGMAENGRSEETAQLRQTMQEPQSGSAVPTERQSNPTGLPAQLKSGIENLSGYSMDDVKVHFNSGKPAQLQAHAYAQGNEIHLAPGQEKHLGHEAWHVVQQKQGRVKPTRQLKSMVQVNDDAGLEKEADVMGKKAMGNSVSHSGNLQHSNASHPTVQRVENEGEEEAEQDGNNAARQLEAVMRLVRVARKFLRKKNVAEKAEKIRRLHAHFGMEWDGSFLFMTEGLRGLKLNMAKNPSNDQDPDTIWEKMLEKYGGAPKAAEWLEGIFKSGNELPNEIQVNAGDVYYKLMPFSDRGGLINSYSPYYLNNRQFRALLNPTVNIEDLLGLPTTSNFIQYKVYKITALQFTTVFESTIAPTKQIKRSELDRGAFWANGHTTKGGGTQTLIIDNGNNNIWRKDIDPAFVLESGESLSEKNIRSLVTWAEFQRRNP